jgi:hypothetical protein
MALSGAAAGFVRFEPGHDTFTRKERTMRRHNVRLVLALSILLGCLCSAQQTPTTSVPNLIRYSASLKDGQGAALPANTPVGVTFAIYNQQDGGAPIWQETQNVTPDGNGQYMVLLGTTTSKGLPDDLFSQQEERWLGVQLQGETEQARVMMVSVPYAFKAHEAETLGGLPASAFMKAPPTEGSGGTTYINATGSAAQTASATGNKATTGKSGVGIDTVVNCTTAKNNYLPIFTAAAPPNITICNSVIYQAGGNIGIGTTTPVAALDVNGAINSSQYYQILGATVLATPSGGENLSVGPGSGGTLSSSGLQPLSGTNNTFVGTMACSSNTGSQNTCIGTEAGVNHTSGDNNAFLGYRACDHNSGGSNSCIGYQTGFYNNGSNNVFLGRSAGFNSTASNMTAVGVTAGYNNTANGNTFLGYSAGTANTSGDSNTFLGNVAGTATTTGSGNTFVGDAAGTSNVTGKNNTFTGQNAGKANTADGNAFYGFNSGVANTTGIQNVFMGYQTGLVNTLGYSNVFIGYNAGQANVDQNYNTFVGTNAGFKSNVGGNTFFGYSAGSNTDVGYGIVATGYDAGRSNTSGILNAYYGFNAGFGGSGSPATTGSGNTYVGTGAGSSSSLTNGGNNTFLGYNAGNAEANVNNAIEIGNSGLNAGDGVIAIGVQGLQSKKTYIAGIYEQQSLSGTRSVVIDASGHLGTGTGGGGGNVMGNCTDPSNGTYITGWVGTGVTSTTVGCSGIFQDLSGNIGIGTTAPSEALDVAGDISANPHGTADRSSYQIGETTILSAFGDRNTILGFTGAHASNANQQNTFIGANAGDVNASGQWNTFLGSASGASNTSGYENTCLGQTACRDLVSGHENVMVGVFAGAVSNPSGSYNTYLGVGAGQSNTSGSSNIYIGSSGTSESNTIRIGTPGTGNAQQNATYIAGIYSGAAGGANREVCVDANGKLWGTTGTCNTSSRRFKDQIANMADSSSKLFQLHPVTFLYKAQYDDGSRSLQYGLIAEEVLKVYPEMVTHDKDGQPSGVKYQLLAPMLLNELQKEHSVVMAQQEQLQTQLQRIDAQRQEIDGLKRQLQLQNASLQERLSKLESYVETQIKTASDTAPRTAPAANGGLQ